MRKLHVNEALREALFKLSVAAYAQGDYMIKSFSGADQADSEMYYGMGRVYCNVARGQELEFTYQAIHIRQMASLERTRHPNS